MTRATRISTTVGGNEVRRKALSILVGLFVTVLLGWGLWALYGYLVDEGSTPSGEAVLVPDLGSAPRTRGVPGRRGDFRGLPQPVVSDGVREVLANTFLVRKQGSLARLTRQTDGSFALRFGYDRSDLLPDDQRRTLRAAYDALNRRGMAEQLKLTPEQTTRLRELGADPGMVVSREDRAAFLDAWTKYHAAPEADRPGIEPELLSLLEQIGNRSLDATRAALAERAAKAASILTPERVQQWLALIQQQRAR